MNQKKNLRIPVKVCLVRIHNKLHSLKLYDMDFSLSNISEPFTLPDDLYIEEVLILSNSNISKLPENLVIDWKLYINGTGIFLLPKSLKVNGYIIVDKENLSYFEEKYPQYQFIVS